MDNADESQVVVFVNVLFRTWVPFFNTGLILSGSFWKRYRHEILFIVSE
jgi:hypothetical protein